MKDFPPIETTVVSLVWVLLAVLSMTAPVGAYDSLPPEVESFVQFAQEEQMGKALVWVEGLSPQARHDLAKFVAHNSDPQLRLFGAALFYEASDAGSVIAILAEGVANEEAELLRSIGWAMTHGEEEDETLVMQIMFGLPRYLIEHLDEYTGARREAVMKEICRGMDECDPEKVLERLAEAESVRAIGGGQSAVRMRSRLA